MWSNKSMSRALTAQHIARRCVSLLLRPAAAAEGLAPPFLCPHSALQTLCERDGSWLPPCVARGSFASRTSHQRGAATVSGGDLPPPPSKAAPVSKRATRSQGRKAEIASALAGKAKQLPDSEQSETGDGSHSAPGSAARNDGSTRSSQSPRHLQTGTGAGAAASFAGSSQGTEGPQSSGQGTGSSDGGNGSPPAPSVVADVGGESEMDTFLEAWDPLMAQVISFTLNPEKL